MLQKAFRVALNRRASWHIERLFWFDWRDPARGHRPLLQLLRVGRPPSPQPQAEARLPGLPALRPSELTASPWRGSGIGAPESILVVRFPRDARGMDATGGRPPVRIGDRDRGHGGFAARRVERLGYPDASSTGSSRPRRSTSRTSRGCSTPGCAPTASCSSGAGSQPTKNTFKWNSSDPFIGELAYHGIRTVPSVGATRAGSPGSGSTPPIGGPRRGQWRTLLGRWWRATAPGGAYWQGLPPAVRRQRQAAADPGMADLERAQPEEVLRPRTRRPASTPTCCRSPMTRSRARTRRPRSCSPGCRATAT